MKKLNLYLKIYVIFFLIISLIDLYFANYRRWCLLGQYWIPHDPEDVDPFISLLLNLPKPPNLGIADFLENLIPISLLLGLTILIGILIFKIFSRKVKTVKTINLLIYGAFLILIYVFYVIAKEFVVCPRASITLGV